MNWGGFDLNLLIVFDAVMQERNVTRAGSRIGLSQSAMSHALNRLRFMLKDELFIRTPEGMVPTPRAEILAQPIQRALGEMQIALEPVKFDPSASERCFKIAVNNYAALVIAPLLVSTVAAVAAKVRLDLCANDPQDIADHLDRGELDLAFSYLENPAERFVAVPLLDVSFVMVMRHDHPASQGKLSAEEFAALSHLKISSISDDTAFIDNLLAENGLVRHIALSAPYISAGPILVHSDLVATVSRRIAQELVRNYPLQICELPYDSQPVHRRMLRMLWHRRLSHHPSHCWLRNIVLSIAKTL